MVKDKKTGKRRLWGLHLGNITIALFCYIEAYLIDFPTNRFMF